ncbi:MAG: CPBP family intramembrane metalloprotease [Firmicutes bacterium]|nr:CPBP family intramembrane metalloprotease [Bacillota bacterium]MBR3391197.1 CPBP family intramembrane metalloprotease [Bacillota bacterium]
MASVLYGGVIEEVMLRLFMMSLIAYLAWKVFFRREANPPTGVIIAANIIAALLFAAGHLPSTMQMFGEITPMILLRCFLLNGAGGLVFGYLYRKYGIQYSMLAHAGAHVVWKIIWIILLQR